MRLTLAQKNILSRAECFLSGNDDLKLIVIDKEKINGVDVWYADFDGNRIVTADTLADVENEITSRHGNGDDVLMLVFDN